MAQQEGSLPAAAESPAARVPWGVADIAMALGLLIVAALLVIVPAVTVAAIIANDPGDLTDDPEALAVVLGANLLLEALLVGAALLFSVGKYHCSLRDLGLRLPRKGSIERFMEWIVSIIFPRWVASVVARIFLPIALLAATFVVIGVYFGIIEAINADPLLPDESSIPKAVFDSPVGLPLAVLLALLFAPLMEETFFRGFIFGSLRWRWGVLWAALASGFLFSALHFSVATLIPFTAIGMLFAWAYAYSGSLFASMAAHFVFNVISFLVSLAQR